MTKHLFPMLPGLSPGADDMKGMRAYLYCRAAYNDGFALELQKEELLRYAKQNGLAIAGIAAEAVETLKKAADKLAKEQPG